MTAYDCERTEYTAEAEMSAAVGGVTNAPAQPAPAILTTPAESWLHLRDPLRKREIACIKGKRFSRSYTLAANGDLQQPFSIDGMVFLMVIDHNFPEYCDDGTIPVKAYIVTPTADELAAIYGNHIMNSIARDGAGNEYLRIAYAENIYGKYARMQTKLSIVECVTESCRSWVRKLITGQRTQRGKKVHINRRQNRRNNNFGWPVAIPKKSGPIRFIQPRQKYTDGRVSRRCPPNPRCSKIVLSDRALVQIYNESASRIETETGGLFLGHFENGVWYVVEASDPGINAKFYNAYHEGDDEYENHVCSVISRTYKHPLVFLGMWHRHPGSLDSFSGTDDRTNFKYAGSAGNGCISAIINYDPDFRITFYYVEQGPDGEVLYTQVDWESGNSRFRNPEMLAVATIRDVEKRMRKGELNHA